MTRKNSAKMVNQAKVVMEGGGGRQDRQVKNTWNFLSNLDVGVVRAHMERVQNLVLEGVGDSPIFLH